MIVSPIQTSRRRAWLALAALLLALPRPVDALTIPFNDKASWLAALGSASDFSFVAANVALAAEVSVLPVHTKLLGTALTFPPASTGLPIGFSFAVDSTEDVQTGGNKIIYVEVSGLGGLGVETNNAEHDWAVTLSPSVFALGMTLRGNGSFDDGIAFYDASGSSLGFFHSPSNPAFVGIISDTPIAKVVYEDTNVSGGRVLLEMSVGAPIPEPGSAGLLALGLAALAAVRRRALA